MGIKTLWDKLKKFIFRVKFLRMKRDFESEPNNKRYSSGWDFKISFEMQDEGLSPSE